MSTTNTYVTPAPITSGAVLSDLSGGGMGAVLDLMITANPAIAVPTVAATVSTSTGTPLTQLASGTYYCTYTWSNAAGETTDGAAHAAESAQFTVVFNTSHVRITIPALPTGATHANIYITLTNGAVHTEVLYASGITTTTYDVGSATYGDPARVPPTANTTDYNQIDVLRLVNSMRRGDFQAVWRKYNDSLGAFFQGDPITTAECMRSLHVCHVVVGMWNKAMTDIGTLVFQHPGTLGTASYSNVSTRTKRTIT